MRNPELLKNYSTTVTPDKTAFELQTLLAGKGANRINIEYENGKPSALSFAIILNNVNLSFRLPCNAEGAYQAMCRMKIAPRYQNRSQAERTAWRNLLLWTEAQLAMVEMRQVEMAEVFMPYMVLEGSSQTLFQKMKADTSLFISNVAPEQKLLGESVN